MKQTVFWLDPLNHEAVEGLKSELTTAMQERNVKFEMGPEGNRFRIILRDAHDDQAANEAAKILIRLGLTLRSGYSEDPTVRSWGEAPAENHNPFR